MDKVKEVAKAALEWCGAHPKFTLAVACLLLGFGLAKVF